MGSPNETRGLPFVDQFIVSLFSCITLPLNPSIDHSLDPGARGLAGLIATLPPYLVIPDAVRTPQSPTSP